MLILENFTRNEPGVLVKIWGRQKKSCVYFQKLNFMNFFPDVSNHIFHM